MTNQMTPEQIAIIEKVKKLMALANNNDNEHQAEAAMAKAMELLAAHNLDMAQIGKTAKGAQRKDNKLKGGLYGWQRNLWQAVSELNFCMYWSIKGLQRGSTYEHRILGSEVNVLSAQIMAEYLQGTVERLAREYAKVHFPGQSIFIRDMIAYREGVATRVAERLRTLRAERVREDERKKREAQATRNHPGAASGGTGLILMDVIYSEEDANYDFLYGYEPGTMARRRAENEARRAAALAAANAALAERDAAELANPALKAARLAQEAKDYDEMIKRWAKEDTKAANRKPRYRNMTPEEERAQLGTFHSGYHKGNEVGLDQQVAKESRPGIGR